MSSARKPGGRSTAAAEIDRLRATLASIGQMANVSTVGGDAAEARAWQALGGIKYLAAKALEAVAS